MFEPILAIVSLVFLIGVAVYLFFHDRSGRTGGWMPSEARAQFHRERSRPPRVPFAAQVDIVALGRNVRGTCVNIAIGGMLLKPEAPLFSGEPVQISFSLPDGTSLRVAGAVCRIQGTAAAIKFDADITRRESLARWIESQISKGKGASSAP